MSARDQWRVYGKKSFSYKPKIPLLNAVDQTEQLQSMMKIQLLQLPFEHIVFAQFGVWLYRG